MGLRLIVRQREREHAALSVQAGLSSTAIRDIVRGNSKSPRIGTARALARVLGYSIEEIIEIGENGALPDKDPDDLDLPPTARGFYRARGFGEDDLDAVADFIEYRAQRKGLPLRPRKPGGPDGT
ncbi:MAG: helix-turn-helix domain-containing protein [Rhodobacteraceae bacterium]|nr:helix-turn-helix domain-containing protein [Paracoccaceae bacterium]